MWHPEFFVYHLSNAAELSVPQYVRKSLLRSFRPAISGEFKEHPNCRTVIEFVDQPGSFLITESIESLVNQLQCQ